MRRSAATPDGDDQDERPSPPGKRKGPVARWRPGSRLTSKADPEKVWAVLQELRDRDGSASVDAVIAHAKNPRSPLHGCFTWDAKVGMPQLWAEQARRLIREVEYVIGDDPNARGERWINVDISVGTDDDESRVYMLERDLENTPHLARFALHEAIIYLSGWVRRYASIGKLAKAKRRIEQALEFLQKLKEG